MSQILTPNKATALAALLLGSVTQAAQAAGVTRETVSEWLNHDLEFQTALKEAESAAIQEACRRLSGAAGIALDTLVKMMIDTSVPPGVRVRSAAVVLEQLIRLREFTDLEARISQLEASK